ncbi:mycothiol conjugate amidase Mca [Calidifontibacter sp. DB0510]|uniref:Mycothiol S-conjugate amidase n=1 Tax=Metallococcus carri TaxID=1656884 RepID=A0A967B0R4_9MICO|nr:mycothiol conjugate amidase Mca [Metallococcus carri]NHN56669.1 mycothiol conjugate amidase Mca [Metallococcus carri]NOP38968.1 mycothiol conjugate amidase Mca [Calidifontibacter sp. DB2511S]
MPERLRLLAVHAHPDDESSKGSATMARYVAEGHRVMVATCTGGERGDVLNPRLKDDADILRDLPQVRREEMKRAQEVLGIEHVWLGFVDSGLPEGDPLPPLPEGCFALEPLHVTTEALVRVIRDFKPHVMTTYDENGGYPHPDHIMCHDVSVAAFRAAGDPSQFTHAGEAWQPLKLYYDRGFSREKIAAFHEALLTRDGESPFEEWLKRWEEREPTRVTTRVQVADYFGARERALLAHATQIDPDGSFFALSAAEQATIWPTEEFDLAASYVRTPADEDDLFAGLPQDVAEADRMATDPPALLRDDIVARKESA